MFLPLSAHTPGKHGQLANWVLILFTLGVSIYGFFHEDFLKHWAGVEQLSYEQASEIVDQRLAEGYYDDMPGTHPASQPATDQARTAPAEPSATDLLTLYYQAETSEEYARAMQDLQTLQRPRLDTTHFPLPVLGIFSTFFHGGWLHLIVNMAFLWVFGNALSCKFGMPLYYMAYLLCGMIASMCHYAMTHQPVIGASGAIYGMMGMYMVIFTHRNIRTLMFLGFYIRMYMLPGWLVIIYYVLWDALFAWLGHDMGVALWAHLGGFAAGFVLAMILMTTGVTTRQAHAVEADSFA